MRLNEVISGLAPLLKQAGGEGIRLDFLLAPQLECTEVDAHQMEQVLLNLVLNARDAMPQGGELTLKTANVWLGQDYVSLHPEVNPGRYVMLAVSDTGCGMDEETKSHIFEPFFTPKEVGKGTGLGLSTVFGIVRQSGGSLDVDTSLGNGATFRVYLPTGQPGASEATEALPSKPLERGTETILVVEDEASVRDLIGRALIRSGYSVLEAGSGPEADEVLNSRDCKPDLLLADVVLPGGQSGWDVAYALRARFPDLRLLFMSGYAREAVVSDWNLDEHVDFLGKPFTWEVLRQKVKNALDAGALSSG